MKAIRYPLHQTAARAPRPAHIVSPPTLGIGAYTAWTARRAHTARCADAFHVVMRQPTNPGPGVDPRADWRGMIHERATGAVGDLVRFVNLDALRVAGAL